MQAQVDASNQAIAEQRRQYDQTRTDFQPFLTAGTGALGQIGDLVGTNGAPQQQTAIDALRNSPFYKQLFSTGEEAVLQNASATGGIRGGNTQTSLADFGRDTLMQTIDHQLSSLGGLATMGLGATGSVSTLGAHTADAVGTQYGVQGQAQAGNFLTKGGINQQNWQNAGAFLDDTAKTIAKAVGGGF